MGMEEGDLKMEVERIREGRWCVRHASQAVPEFF
jgi:hypothetical protein